MLLVLLVAGRTDRRIIERHRRLEGYSVDDFSVLARLIRNSGGTVWVTPSTLTEASNLLGQHGGAERERLFRTLASLISESREVLVHSSQAATNIHFNDLGLTDAALLEVISPERPLLTADGRLYAAALTSDAQSTTNFNHHRASELGT